MNKNTKLILAGLFLLFIIIRLPGLGLPYHQDEWKAVLAAASMEDAGLLFAHPPLMQMLFVGGRALFGEDSFRLVPLIFSVLSLVMLYLVVRRRFSSATALWSVFLATICFYNIWASLMIDVDGAVLPFLFLVAVYCYDRYISAENHHQLKWLVSLSVALLIGCLLKLSFILVVDALLFDYLISRWREGKWRGLARVISAGLGFGLIYVALLYLIQWLYPAFSISFMLGHANQFTEDLGRNYTQILIQVIKSVFYLSPLFLLLLWSSRRFFQKTRLFWIYLVFGLFFFLILFDFSRGALDKYLMFAIIPISILAANVITENVYLFRNLNRQKFVLISLASLLVAGALLALNFFPQNILSLYPKTAWFGVVFGGHWNFLNPFTGGSGPIGFYISFLFIAVSFAISFLAIIVGRFSKPFRPVALIIVLVICLAYNLVLAEELFIGQINGGAPTVLVSAVQFIATKPEIKKVITYNDIGNHELSRLGKYAGRFYVAPQFEEGHKKFFAAQKDSAQFLVVDLPHLNPESFYGIFFSKCRVLFQDASGQVKAYLYSC